MARKRVISPEFWTDEKVSQATLPARLLFIAAWNFADDYGGLDRSPKQLKAQAFPYDEFDCEPLLKELIQLGLLIEYQVAGQIYLHVKNFLKWQTINRPSLPRVPKFNECSPTTHGVLTEYSVTTHSELKELNELKEGREGNGKGNQTQSAASALTAGPAAQEKAGPKSARELLGMSALKL